MAKPDRLFEAIEKIGKALAMANGPLSAHAQRRDKHYRLFSLEDGGIVLVIQNHSKNPRAKETRFEYGPGGWSGSIFNRTARGFTKHTYFRPSHVGLQRVAAEILKLQWEKDLL